MRQRLAVKAHRSAPKSGQHLGMGGFHHLGRRLHPRIAGPAAKGRAQRGLFGGTIGAVGGGAEFEDALAIGQHHGGIHPVQRGARHRPKAQTAPPFQHLPLRPCPGYTAPAR
jgi:hypothetical protein